MSRIKLEIPSCNVWVSADTHFGHKNATGVKMSNWDEGYRTFDSIEEMDQELIKQINNNVKEDDYFFILGDFAYLNRLPVEWYRKQINCKNVYLIRGNHDNEKASQKAGFQGIYDYLELEINKQLICMFHYKPFIWNKSHKGSIFLYGHSHASSEQHVIGKSIDVGVDNAYRLLGEYKPFNLDEILDLMSKREILLLDHHNSKTNR